MPSVFFYVISGFLIHLHAAAKVSTSADGALSFYRNRFIRIFSLFGRW